MPIGTPDASGLRLEPVEEFIAQEPQLAPTGKAMARDLAVAHELAEVFDVDVEEVGCHCRSEDGRELGVGHRVHATASLGSRS
jgi:hypothetical protein